MKRGLVFFLLVLAGALLSVRWPSRAEPAGPVACAGSGCGGVEDRLSALKAQYRRPAEIPFPEENPYTPAKDALGRLLFFDPLLSKSETVSCATCHNPSLSWGDGLPRAIGDISEALPIRSPTVLNLAWLSVMGWDGKFASLEDVTFAPITGRMNMGLSEPLVLARLGANPGYVARFKAAFGDGAVTRERIEDAVATYERTIVSTPAPFDHWIEGEENAIGPAAKRGFELFNGKAGCAACHSGWAFTDGSFHDIGTATGDDVGRGARFPSSVKLRYAFKVPTLRDAARRAPYMHDGSVATLADVVALYDQGGIDRPSRSVKIKPLGLSAQEKADLIAFIRTLTSDPDTVALPVLPR